MTKINKITELAPYKKADKEICEIIQCHIDEQNTDGYYLVTVECFSGFYRFFWVKDVE